MSIPLLLPDILLLGLGVMILALDLARVKASLVWNVAWMGLIAVLVVLNLIPAGWDRAWFGGNWNLSNFGLLMREFFILSALVTTLLARSNFVRGEEGFGPMRYKPEFLAALIFVTFGAITVVSSKDLLTLFVGLELATIPLYFLVAWNKENAKASEAATKFVLLGSTSTATMLFGMSYLYGFAGSLRFANIGEAVASSPTSPLLWIAVLFLTAGIGFKLTLFPFHSWAPDVYDGASTPITAFLSVSSKATAISFLIIMVYGPLAAIQVQLQPLLILLSAATMTVGNLGAMKQTRLRRFMAWSSIAQAGYILAALTGPAMSARSSVVFYLFTYAFSNYLVFFIASLVSDRREQTFASLTGLSRQKPWLGAALAIGLFSLAGIPPVAGFVGKFMLFGSAAKAGHFAFLIFVGVNTVIGLYCYLQVLKAGWVDTGEEAQEEANKNLRLSFTEGASITLLTLLVLGAGIAPWLGNNIAAVLQYGP